MRHTPLYVRGLLTDFRNMLALAAMLVATALAMAVDAAPAVRIDVVFPIRPRLRCSTKVPDQWS